MNALATIAICLTIIVVSALRFSRWVLERDEEQERDRQLDELGPLERNPFRYGALIREDPGLPEYDRFLRRPMPTMTEEERRRADEMGLP